MPPSAPLCALLPPPSLPPSPPTSPHLPPLHPSEQRTHFSHSLAHSSQVLMPITLNVKSSVPADVAIRLSYSLAVVFTYPLQLLPIADMLGKAISYCWPSLPMLFRNSSRMLIITESAFVGSKVSPPRIRLVSRVALITLTCVVAVLGMQSYRRIPTPP